MKVIFWCLRLAAVAAACKTEMDCQLNGICRKGSCICDSGWRGTECDELDLLPPASLTPAYGGIMGGNGTTSWGASVVQSASGSFHMFVAEMANSCGMTTWATNSIIRHAVASAPEGPYLAREVVMPPFAHNPTALRAPDGTYLIYHIGCGTPNKGIAPCTDCAGGKTGASCHSSGEAVACSSNTTNILYSQSLDGPWHQLNAPFIKSTTMGTPFQIDNPTVTFFANGSLLMLGRGGDLRRESSSDGVITAPHWRGPYTMHGVVGDKASPNVEDPFVWRDKRGNFHALFHKFTDEHPSCGGHAFSRDGFTWTLTNTAAYTTTITTTSGAIHNFNRRERPHLLLDTATSTRPVVLYTSLTNWGANKGKDDAFTFAQRVNDRAVSLA